MTTKIQEITRIALVGTGNIAETHAAVIRAVPGLELAAVVDALPAKAASFAGRWGVPRTYQDAAALIDAGGIDAAHVLVPPPLHRAVAEPLLRAGIAVFLEKPMAESVAQCDSLVQAAAEGGAALRVNHNFVHHPAQRAARRMLDENRIGPLRHVSFRYSLPLRQLGARQLGHWMFESPLNLLLEQAVHPLSQLVDFLGEAPDLTAVPGPCLSVGEGRTIQHRWMAALAAGDRTADLYLSLGESYSSWGAVLIGTDGVLSVDYQQNRVMRETQGRWIDLADSLIGGSCQATSLARQSIANFVGGAASMMRLRTRTDWFFRSMLGSIEGFYADLRRPRGDLGGEDGRRIVALCERIASVLPPGEPRPAPRPAVGEATGHDVLVIGGSGFIGSHVVARLVADGARVGVLARNVRNLPPPFTGPRVALFGGNARSPDDVRRAIGGASVVIDLAHGGGGASRAETEEVLVGAARTVAESCLAAGVRRLVYASSIAALYLGDPAETITGQTPVDPRHDERADYSRAKAIAELALLELRRTRGLPVTIVRPGIVIGAGGIAFHSGIGFYNRERHCLGWNRGLNPLPLVLVEDVADAIVRAARAPEIEGRCYNLVGDVRLDARDYIAELARATHRPLRYHPQSVLKLYAVECVKVGIKKLSGRSSPWPSLRDLKSRGLVAAFDCSDAARDLDWHPVGDRAEFVRRGFCIDAEIG